MGGNNGFTDFKFLLGFDVREAATQRGLFVVTAVTLLVVYLACRWLNGTKFGLVQQAVRDGENRALFSGYATAHFKLFIFIVSALIASIGGALYVPQVGIINPSEMTPEKSLEAVVWVAVGGRGTLLGPVIGAVAVNALKSWATRAIPDLWILLMGGLFILAVLFLPGGIVSIPGKLRGWLAKRRPTPALAPAVDPVAPPALKAEN
jgi:urea transport system permease protein